MNVWKDKGFTLVEVLMSVAVLGLVTMGMAAMHGIAITSNVDANDLSVVTNVASDMMERIQSNRRYAWAYNNLQTAGAGNCGPGGVPAPFPATNPPFGGRDASSGTAQTLKTRRIQGDCVQWGALVRATNLANVQGLVQVNPVVPTSDKSGAVIVAVQIAWNERSFGQRQRILVFRTVIEPEE